jgi:hypothetical protein
MARPFTAGSKGSAADADGDNRNRSECRAHMIFGISAMRT